MTRARQDELAEALHRTQDRITAAARGAGRDPDEITLVVVTKFFPAADVAILVDLGVSDIGESRDQEAAAKVADLAALLGPGRVPRVHFVGQVQRNKAVSVAEYADVVHSVDREQLAAALDRGAERAGRFLDVLVQVDLDGRVESRRGGVAPHQLDGLVAGVEALEHLRLRGLMAVAPRDGDPDAAFGRLAELARQVRAAQPQAWWISAGMSGDLELAVAHGATHLRVGTAILGSRPPQR